MTDPIKPALTPDEWRLFLNGPSAKERDDFWNLRYGVKVYAPMAVEYTGFIGEDDSHADAALALYGQPFGFTWEDVDLCFSWNESPTVRAALTNLGTRIVALLPPRETPSE